MSIREMIRSGQIKAASVKIDGNAIRTDGRKHTKPVYDSIKAKRRAANKRARKARR